MRGTVVLAWPASKIAGLFERLVHWGSAVDESAGTFTGPHGSRFAVEPVADDVAHHAIGPVKHHPRTGDLPGGASEGVGLRAVRFDVPAGAAAPICRFYDAIFRAATRLLHKKTTCVVKIGHNQALEFVETDDDVPAYDGHHVCLYVNGQQFIDIYDALFVRGLHYSNPRFPQARVHSIYDALQHHEFRFKDIADLSVPAHPHPIVYELEHEIRSLNHPGFSMKNHLPPYVEPDL